MELRQVTGLFRPAWQNKPFEQWSDELHDVCGNYDPVPVDGRSRVLGMVEASRIGDIEFAHVVKDLARVERTRDGIRRDQNEFLFMIIQLGGVAGIEQLGQQSVLEAGDCILVDSARPSSFVFEGRFSNQLSVHLPRQLMYSLSPVRFAVSTRLDRRDPMALTIRSLVAKLMLLEFAGQRKAHMCTLLHDTIRYAFEFDESDAILPRLSGHFQRVEYIDELIDRHLTDPELSPAWLAQRSNMPLRRIQEDFQQAGLAISAVIRDKRLTLAAQKLASPPLPGRKVNVAQIAFSSGFNDVSYFNRCFRETYGLTPTEYARTRSEAGEA